MKYMGSKNRIAAEITPVFNQLNDRKIWVEPFVGGANIIDKVDFEIRKGYDKNPYLIDLWKYLVYENGDLPLTISEHKYHKVRNNMSDYPNWEVGLVGFCASYGGRFFEGYPRGKNIDGTPRDYTNEAIRNLRNQIPLLKNVIFEYSDYKNLDIREITAVIYCDPPYFGTKPYKTSILGKFNHKEFWNWVNIQSEFNPVFVSEYIAPDDYECIWQQPLKSNLKQGDSKKSTEKLFIHKSWNKKLKIISMFDQLNLFA